jgi:putative DNA primase/helicase
VFMNNLETMKNIKRMQSQVDAFVSDQPLPDLIYTPDIMNAMSKARNEASYRADQATGEVLAPIAISETGKAVVVSEKPLDRSVIKVNLIKGSTIKMRPITWLWDQWLPSGKLTMLGGAGGTGKTTLALGLASTITTGGIFPDHSRYCGKSNVLIWSSEDDPEDVLMPRLSAMGADLSRIYILEGTVEGGKRRGFDPSVDIERLKQAISQIGGVSLIIIDPIVGMVKGNMNNANEVRQSLDPLVEFAQGQQCAIIGISHLGKGSQQKDPAERLLGSQAFTALPRMVWVTVTNKETGDRVLVRAKTNISRKDGGFTYSIEQKETNGIHTSIVMWKGAIEGLAHEILSDAESIDDDSEGSYGKESARKALVEILRHGEMLQKDIKSELTEDGFSWATIRRAKDMGAVFDYKKEFRGVTYWSLENPQNSKGAQIIPKMLSVLSEQVREKVSKLGESEQVSSEAIDLSNETEYHRFPESDPSAEECF